MSFHRIVNFPYRLSALRQCAQGWRKEISRTRAQAFSLYRYFFTFWSYSFTMPFKHQTSRLLSVKGYPSHLLHRSFTADDFFRNAYGYEFFSVRLRIQSCTLWIFFRTVTVMPVTVPEYFSARLRGWTEKTDGKSWISWWKNLIFWQNFYVMVSKKPIYIS